MHILNRKHWQSMKLWYSVVILGWISNSWLFDFIKGEIIPIRLYLSSFDLAPTYRDINKKFSTRYFLNLVLVDEDNRKYFKQQEISIYRTKGTNLFDKRE